MKIAICGSMTFAKEMLATKKELEKLGHSVEIPFGVDNYANGTIAEEDKWTKIKNDVIKEYFEKIKSIDAVLILNKDKNSISNYVGGNALLELGFAHVLGKKKYLLNPIPDKVSYFNEIEAMEPTVLNGDLTKI